MNRRLIEISEEIKTLTELESEMEKYIEEVRKEQLELRNFILEMVEASWQKGLGKEAFVNKMILFDEQFTREIHRLENRLIDIEFIKKRMINLYSSVIPY